MDGDKEGKAGHVSVMDQNGRNHSWLLLFNATHWQLRYAGFVMANLRLLAHQAMQIGLPWLGLFMFANSVFRSFTMSALMVAIIPDGCVFNHYDKCLVNLVRAFENYMNGAFLFVLTPSKSYQFPNVFAEAIMPSYSFSALCSGITELLYWLSPPGSGVFSFPV